MLLNRVSDKLVLGFGSIKGTPNLTTSRATLFPVNVVGGALLKTSMKITQNG
jgi:hypothetical protein